MQLDPKSKIAEAEKACQKALASWKGAVAAMGNNVSVNGAGIIHDRSAFRQRLCQARGEIEQALAIMEGVDWPSDADYDAL